MTTPDPLVSATSAGDLVAELSARGQTVISDESKLYAIRSDVKGDTTSAELIAQIGAKNIKPVPVHPALLVYLAPAKRMAFLKQWKDTAGKK